MANAQWDKCRHFARLVMSKARPPSISLNKTELYLECTLDKEVDSENKRLKKEEYVVSLTITLLHVPFLCLLHAFIYFDQGEEMKHYIAQVFII